MVRAVRFELTTNGLKGRYSTAELHPHLYIGDSTGNRTPIVGMKIRCPGR